MGQPFFQFRQFAVYHDQCAMKVGTDGVLLGAWTEAASAQRILDIGTGSGLIALMLAQKSSALIDAIEIDPDAAAQATENFARSPWSDRLRLWQGDFLSFSHPPLSCYDLIVSNPPYFRNSLESPDSQRTCARHNSSLSLENLVRHACSLLTPQGRLNLILPALYLPDIEMMLQMSGLYQNHLLSVSDKEGSKVKRVLISASFDQQNSCQETLFLKDQNNKRSPQLQTITRDYYL